MVPSRDRPVGCVICNNMSVISDNIQILAQMTDILLQMIPP
jgi:hypothetical protein